MIFPRFQLTQHLHRHHRHHRHYHVINTSSPLVSLFRNKEVQSCHYHIQSARVSAPLSAATAVTVPVTSSTAELFNSLLLEQQTREQILSISTTNDNDKPEKGDANDDNNNDDNDNSSGGDNHEENYKQTQSTTDSSAAAEAAEAATTSPYNLSNHLRPAQVVSSLDSHIVGQHDAKRAVAIAMRNRWRRKQLANKDLIKEVTPRNVLMIGPTGCG